MDKMLLGIFENRSAADAAVTDLETAGFNAKDISIVMKGEEVTDGEGETRGESAAEGALSGATTGGVIGGVAGLLMGIGALTIPGVGALLIGGPLAAALGLTGAAATTVSGALTGAAAGGLIGGLVGLGVPEEEAKVYEERIKEGAILLAVPTSDENEDDARRILEEQGASQVRAVSQNN